VNSRYAGILAIALLSLFLGFAAAFSSQTIPGSGPAITPSLGSVSAAGLAGSTIVFCVLVLLFRVLPKRLGLPVQIFVAMILGVVAGRLLPWMGFEVLITDYVGIFGKLFILLLKLVIIPLIFVSIVCGVAGIGDVRKLGSLGFKTLAYYFCTTAVAVLIGLACVNLLRPGIGRESLRDTLVQEEAAAAQESEEPAPSLGTRIQQEMLPRIIQNPIMAGQNPLVIIFFAILLGAALAALNAEAEPALRVFRALDKAFITLVLWVMNMAPVGVFALMATAIADLGLGYVATLGKYCLTVFLGLGIHFCFLTLLVIPLLARISPLRYLRGMIPAFELSFSSSSSSATLPVTIDCASRGVGADENICNFMLPVGATINMDGTALYTSIASLFIAQVYGIELGLQQQLMVFLTAILVSVGTAGIPGASIGLLSIILSSVGIPVEGIGLIVGVDRLLDMSRTVVNITGDSVGAVVVSRSERVLREV
jgi:Na+/H+-dicarboxylate symporter